MYRGRQAPQHTRASRHTHTHTFEAPFFCLSQMKRMPPRCRQTNQKFNQSQGVVIRAYCTHRWWQACVSVGVCRCAHTHTHKHIVTFSRNIQTVSLTHAHTKKDWYCVFYTYPPTHTYTHTHTHLRHSTLHCHSAGTFNCVSFPLQSASRQTKRVTSWSVVFAFSTQIKAHYRDH